MPPITPQNLRLSPFVEVNGIAFEWDEIPGATYELEISYLLPSLFSKATNNWRTAGATYRAADLRGSGQTFTYSGTYTFRVRARDASGRGPWATLTRTNAYVTEPDDMDGERVSGIDANSATFTYGSDELPTSEYQHWSVDVRYRRQGRSSWDREVNGNHDSRNNSGAFFMSGLAEGTTYEVEGRYNNVFQGQVAASARSSGWDRKTFTTTERVIPPGTPTGLGVTGAYDDAVTSTSVSLGWRASNVATAYDIRYYVSSEGVSTADTISTTINRHVVTGLAEDTGYTFQVRARNSAGTSGWSVKFSTDTKGTPPATPGTPGFTGKTHDSITVAVAAVDGATSYQWRYRESSSRIGYTIRTSLAPNFTATGLKASTNYTFAVRARNSDGNSGWSINASTATEAEPIRSLNPVKNMTAVAGSDGRSIAIDWDAPDPVFGVAVQSYTVQFKVSVHGGWSTATSSNVATDYNLTGISTGTNYDVRVAPNTAIGRGPWVTITNIGTPSAPETPGTIGLEERTHNSLTVRWSAVSGAKTYTLRRKQANLNDYTYFNGLTAVSHKSTGLDAETSYVFQVRAVI